jgi:hypothetical protein
MMFKQHYNKPVMIYRCNGTAQLQVIPVLLLFGYSAGEDAEAVGYLNRM